MIILHENLQREAEKVAAALKKVYGFPVELESRNMDNWFIPLPKFNGFFYQLTEAIETPLLQSPKNIQIITSKDIFAQDKIKEDDWIFGYCNGNVTVSSTARLKRNDNQPSEKLEVPEVLYFSRLENLSIHEVGHHVVKGKHFKPAEWVNAKTGHRLELGPHCDDNRCVMYEIVDIRAPKPEEGFMLLGKERKFDAGMDDVLARMYPSFFCERCKSCIEIPESYFIKSIKSVGL